MQPRLQLAADAASLLLSKATFIGLRLLTLYLCAVQVDRTVFGPIALAFTSAEMSRYVGDWGTDTWALRRFSHPDVGNARNCFAWVVRLRLFSTGLAVLIAFVVISLLSANLEPGLRLAIALTAGTSLWMNVGVNWLQARAALRSTMAPLLLLGAGCVAAEIGLARGGATPTLLIAVQVGIECLLAACVVAMAFRRERVAPTGEGISVASWLREATPIALAALLALGYGRLDQYFVSTTAPVAVLGDYVLAQRLVEPLLFLAAALSSTLYARASGFMHAYGLGGESRQFTFRWVRAVSLGALAACLIGGVLLTAVCMRWLPQYIGIQPYLWLALGCTFFRCTNLALTAFIQAAGAFGTMFRISLANAALITVGVFSLGNILGPIGAALGVCAGEALNTCIQAFMLNKLLISENKK
jgi:O-antigen/teichoic acid export membrane protein